MSSNVYKFATRLGTASALLLICFLNFPTIVVPHGFSPILMPRHFDERMLRDVPAATLKVVTKDGTKKQLKLVEKEDGKKVWKWMKEGEEEPKKRSWRRNTKKEEAAREFLFDPPTPDEQEEFQDGLLKKQDVAFRVKKDVYADYHKEVRKYEDNKKITVTKTVPTKFEEIEHDKNNLFRALAFALAGTEELHKAMRAYIREYYETFYGKWSKKREQAWMDEFEIRSVSRRGDELKNGEAGGLAEVVAAAKKLDINVLVYKTENNTWLCMSPKTQHKEDIEKKGDCQDKNKLTIALEFLDGEHFDVVLDVGQKK